MKCASVLLLIISLYYGTASHNYYDENIPTDTRRSYGTVVQSVFAGIIGNNLVEKLETLREDMIARKPELKPFMEEELQQNNFQNNFEEKRNHFVDKLETPREDMIARKPELKPFMKEKVQQYNFENNFEEKTNHLVEKLERLRDDMAARKPELQPFLEEELKQDHFRNDFEDQSMTNGASSLWDYLKKKFLEPWQETGQQKVEKTWRSSYKKQYLGNQEIVDGKITVEKQEDINDEEDYVDILGSITTVETITTNHESTSNETETEVATTIADVAKPNETFNQNELIDRESGFDNSTASISTSNGLDFESTTELQRTSLNPAETQEDRSPSNYQSFKKISGITNEILQTTQESIIEETTLKSFIITEFIQNDLPIQPDVLDFTTEKAEEGFATTEQIPLDNTLVLSSTIIGDVNQSTNVLPRTESINGFQDVLEQPSKIDEALKIDVPKKENGAHSSRTSTIDVKDIFTISDGDVNGDVTDVTLSKPDVAGTINVNTKEEKKGILWKDGKFIDSFKVAQTNEDFRQSIGFDKNPEVSTMTYQEEIMHDVVPKVASRADKEATHIEDEKKNPNTIHDRREIGTRAADLNNFPLNQDQKKYANVDLALDEFKHKSLLTITDDYSGDLSEVSTISYHPEFFGEIALPIAAKTLKETSKSLTKSRTLAKGHGVSIVNEESMPNFRSLETNSNKGIHGYIKKPITLHESIRASDERYNGASTSKADQSKPTTLENNFDLQSSKKAVKKRNSFNEVNLLRPRATQFVIQVPTALHPELLG